MADKYIPFGIFTPGFAPSHEQPGSKSPLDLNRYVGRWHEIARLPNRFEKKCAGSVTATYNLRTDGKIEVVNGCTRI